MSYNLSYIYLLALPASNSVANRLSIAFCQNLIINSWYRSTCTNLCRTAPTFTKLRGCKLHQPSLAPNRSRLDQSWTLPWAVTSLRDTRRELVLSPALSQTSRGQRGKRERLGTRLAPTYTTPDWTGSNCTNMPQITPNYTNLHQLEQTYMCIKHQTATTCTKLHKSAPPNYTKLHQPTPNYTKL